MKHFAVVIAVIMSVQYACSQTYAGGDKLYTCIMTRYIKQLRPLLNQTDVIQVNANYDIGGIQEIDDEAGTMTVYFVFRYSWYDERISWNTRLYNNTRTTALSLDLVWKSELIVANPPSSVISFDTSVTTVRYFSNGLVVWFRTRIIKVSYSIDIKYYP